MKENLQKTMMEFVITYCVTTTATVFVGAVYLSLFWREALLSHDVLWMNLLMCFVCCLCNFIHPFSETGRKGILLNVMTRYLYINVVILGGGHIFRWLDITNVLMLAVMMLEILIVFLMVSAVMWRIQQKESEQLNQKLQEYKSAEEMKMKNTN